MAHQIEDFLNDNVKWLLHACESDYTGGMYDHNCDCKQVRVNVWNRIIVMINVRLGLGLGLGSVTGPWSGLGSGLG